MVCYYLYFQLVGNSDLKYWHCSKRGILRWRKYEEWYFQYDAARSGSHISSIFIAVDQFNHWLLVEIDKTLKMIVKEVGEGWAKDDWARELHKKFMGVPPPPDITQGDFTAARAQAHYDSGTIYVMRHYYCCFCMWNAVRSKYNVNWMKWWASLYIEVRRYQ